MTWGGGDLFELEFVVVVEGQGEMGDRVGDRFTGVTVKVVVVAVVIAVVDVLVVIRKASVLVSHYRRRRNGNGKDAQTRSEEGVYV